MPNYLLDTNHLSAAATPGHRLRGVIIRHAREGGRFGTCVPVLCELEAGIQRTRGPDAYRQELDGLLKYVRIWPLREEFAPTYGTIWLDLRSRGRVLSQVDVMIAAMALHHRASILTTDRDFEALPQVKTENWLM